MRETAKRLLLNKKFLWVLLCLWFVPGGILHGAAWQPAAEKGPNPTAPDFTLSTLQGNSVSLKSQRGKDVVLVFFATWCPACRRTIGTISKDRDKLRGEGIQIFLIDAGETAAKVESFKRANEVPFDILLDTTMRVANDYDVVGIPAFFLVSKEGLVVYEGHELPRNYRDYFGSVAK